MNRFQHDGINPEPTKLQRERALERKQYRKKKRNLSPTGYDKVAGKQRAARIAQFEAQSRGNSGDGYRKRPTGYHKPGSMKRKAL